MSADLPADFQPLFSFISTQLNPESISSLISSSIESSLSEYLSNFIKAELESLVKSLVSKEIELIKSHINEVIIDIYQHLQRNLDMLRSLEIYLSNKSISKQVDPIMAAFDDKRYSDAFSLLLTLEDDKTRDEYLKIVNFSDVNDENLDQKVATDLAAWAINRSNKILLEKLITIIRKGEGLTQLLRKIVAKQDQNLSAARAMIIKKSL